MKLKKGSLEAKKFMAKIRAKKGKPKKVNGVKYKKPKLFKPTKKETTKAVKRLVKESLHTDKNSHNYKISISGNIKLSPSNLKFLEIVKKNSKGYNFRAKILWGQPVVLKETKQGTPVEAFNNIGEFDECKIFADELNKGQKYINVKIKTKK